MKKNYCATILLALLLGFYGKAFSQGVSPPPSLYRGESLMANLPTSPAKGTMYMVTDTDGSACNVSGSTRLLCEFNGSAYQIAGSGTVTTTGGDVFGPASSTSGKA